MQTIEAKDTSISLGFESTPQLPVVSGSGNAAIVAKGNTVDFPTLPALYYEDSLTGSTRSRIMKKVIGRSEELQKLYENLDSSQESAIELYNIIVEHLLGERRGTLLHHRKTFQKNSDSDDGSEFIGKGSPRNILKDYLTLVAYLENILKDLASRYKISGFMESFEQYQKKKGEIWSEYEVGYIDNLPQIDWTGDSQSSVGYLKQGYVGGVASIKGSTQKNIYGVLTGENRIGNNTTFSLLAQKVPGYLASFENDNNIKGLDQGKLLSFIENKLQKKFVNGKSIKLHTEKPLVSPNFTESVSLQFREIGEIECFVEFIGSEEFPPLIKDIFYDLNVEDPEQDIASIFKVIAYLEKFSKSRPDIVKAYDRILKSEVHLSIYTYFTSQIIGDFSNIEEVVRGYGEMIIFLSRHYDDIEKITDWIGKNNFFDVMNTREFTLVDLISELNSVASEYMPLSFGKCVDTKLVPEHVLSELKGKRYIHAIDLHVVKANYSSTDRYQSCMFLSNEDLQKRLEIKKQGQRNTGYSMYELFGTPNDDYELIYPGVAYVGYDEVNRHREVVGEKVVVAYNSGEIIYSSPQIKGMPAPRRIGKTKDLILSDLGLSWKHTGNISEIDKESFLGRVELYIRSEYPDIEVILSKKGLTLINPFNRLCGKVLLDIEDNTLIISSTTGGKPVEGFVKKEVFGYIAKALNEITQ